jgi:hypothetical protein
MAETMILEAPGGTFGKKTETAGTAIVRVIPPKPVRQARVRALWYDNAGTAHTITLMRPLSSSTASVAADAGQTDITVNSALPDAGGNPPAAGDLVIFKDVTGAWDYGEVSSYSNLVITLTANLTSQIPAGNTIYFMGAPADHADEGQFPAKASVRTVLENILFTTVNTNQPILVHSNNGTAAGTLEMVTFDYPKPAA